MVLSSGISYYSGTKGYDRVAYRYRLVTILQTDLCIYSEIHIYTALLLYNTVLVTRAMLAIGAPVRYIHY